MGDESNTFFGNMVPVKVRDGVLVVDTTGADGTGGGGGGGGGAITVADGADVAQGALADAIAGATLTDPWTAISLLKAITDRLRLTLDVDDADTQTALALLLASIGDPTNSAAIGNVTGTLIAHLRQLNKLATAFTDLANSRINAALATTLDKMNDEVAAVLPQCTLAEADLASTTVATAVAAPGAGSHLEIYRLQIQSLADGAQDITWREGTGGSDLRKTRLLTNGSIISSRLSGSWHLATNTALAVKASAATSLHWLVEYRTVLDSARA